MREKEQKGARVCQIDELRPVTDRYEKDTRRIPNSGNRLIDNRVAARVATHCCFAACEAPTMDFHELALVPTHPRAHGQPPPGRRRTSRTTGTSQSCRPPHPRDAHTACLPPKVSLLQTARPSRSAAAESRREIRATSYSTRSTNSAQRSAADDLKCAKLRNAIKKNSVVRIIASRCRLLD